MIDSYSIGLSSLPKLDSTKSYILSSIVVFVKLLFIISEKNDKIAKAIGDKVKRGVTGLYGKGMYKEKDKLVLICAASRGDISKIKDITKRIDEKSFIVIANAREVLGKGFKEK